MQQFFLDTVLRAGAGIVFIGTTNIVDIFLSSGRNSFSHQRSPTISTEQSAAEGMYRSVSAACTGILLHQTLNQFKISSGNDCLMGSCNSDPFTLILENLGLGLVIGGRALSLHHNTSVYFIFQNSPDRNMAPFCNRRFLEGRFKAESLRPLVLQGGQDSFPVESFCDTVGAVSINFPTENVTDNGRRIVIDQKTILVLRILPVTIDGEVGDALSLLPLDRQVASDLNGNVTAVRIIDQILERDQQAIRMPLVCRVIVIVHRNEAHPQLREQFFDILATINIVSAKTRQILDDDTVDQTLSDIHHHSLEIRSVKIGSGVAIVLVFSNQCHLRMTCQIVHQQLSLIVNTVAFGFSAAGQRKIAIILRQAKIDGDPISLVNDLIHCATPSCILRKFAYAARVVADFVHAHYSIGPFKKPVLFAGKSSTRLSLHSGKHIAEVVGQGAICIGKGHSDLYISNPEAIGVFYLFNVGPDPFFNRQTGIDVDIPDVHQF